ncbi:glycosyltransferase family 4 protein [Arsukibacterium sp.]|uniref:glycosyltransferase family 4 protein n=1 Tax=Arsukibacterium sp. TaxID=1977258 RepID=UPI00299D426B|nr:glycosyltransferase family 4 protein [Arsukibacterium sp.]MDX1538544.1 glycosyltransferase family 4 protein [Arsukibacterium sp.]
MDKKKAYIFVGAKEPKVMTSNPGGQLTASIGLKKYAMAHGFDFFVVDTTQSSFPVPSFFFRVKKGLSRLFQVLVLLIRHKVSGIIIFSSHGFSFYERIAITMLSNIFSVKSLFFMRSGLFKDEVANSIIKRFLTRCLLHSPTVIGIQGDSWRPFYERLGVVEERILTVPNWLPEHVSVVDAPLGLDIDVVNFCFVGWIVKEKGIIELLHAISLVKQKTNAFNFTFVGGGTLENFVREYVQRNNLDNIVDILGWCNPQQVAETLSKSHVFVLPSHAEGFPNSLLEAMALGLPAICTGVGAISDSLKNEVNGFVVPVDSPSAISNAMLRYLNEPALLHKHSLSTLEIIKRLHDRDENCRRIFDMLNR